MEYINKIKYLLDTKAKHKLILLIVFSILVSIIETIGISAIMPFIDIATNFDSIQSNKYYRWVFDVFSFESKVNFAIAFGCVLSIFYVFRAIMNLTYSYLMARFTQSMYAQITQKLFKTYISMPYKDFTNKNSSYLTKSIITEASLVSDVIGAVLLMISEIFVVTFLYILMLLASWKITLIFTAVLIIKIFLLTQTISKKIKAFGVVRAKTEEKIYEISNRVFGDFKNIKLQDRDRLQNLEDSFSLKVKGYARVSSISTFLKDFPRVFIETIGFSLVVFMLIILLYLNQSNVMHILPTLSLFVLALYRLMPSVNRIVSGYNVFMYHHKSIDIVMDELKIKQEDLSNETIQFNNEILLKNIDFKYRDKLILKNINLQIKKGQRISFVGESGSGKSTLVDLIIGLHYPNRGEILIDGIQINSNNIQHWRSQIGYIPQQVYLFDGTIEENVCFGRNLDNSLLEKVLKQANIFDYLKTKQGVNTLVGEGGIQLSGGQKQRIAIARALYGQPEILILDEATSALDNNTEKKIMDEIYQISKDKTLIIIAHRLSTINECDKVYEIKNGMLR
jgi:ATP-binding cassette, subfamily B, bacterial PglK